MRKVRSYLILNFSLSWGLIGLYRLAGGKWHSNTAVLIGIFYMFIPLISIFIVQKLIYKEPLKEYLGLNFKINYWWIVAWIFPVILALLTFLVSLTFPTVEYSPDFTGFFERMKDYVSDEKLKITKEKFKTVSLLPFWISIGNALIAGATINAIAAYGEEAGWRGFLFKELKHLGFWKMSILIGSIWGIWHAPIILMGHNYPQHPQIGVIFMIIFCILLSPILFFIRLKTNSVIPCAIAHGTLNASSGIAILLIKGGNDLLVGITGIAGLIILALFNLVILLMSRRENIMDETKY